MRQPKLPLVMSKSCSLEPDLRADLYLTRRVDEVAVGIGRGTEQWIEAFINVEVEAWGRRAANNVSIGGCYGAGGDGIRRGIHASHILLIGDIEEIAKQLDAIFFGHFKALGETYVANPVNWLLESITADIDSIRSSRAVDTADC